MHSARDNSRDNRRNSAEKSGASQKNWTPKDDKRQVVTVGGVVFSSFNPGKRVNKSHHWVYEQASAGKI